MIGEVHTEFWCGNLRKRANFRELGVDGWIILRSIFKKWNGAWTGLVWLKMGTGGVLL
jgi:hypothetical protein